jgi:diguanylate cyclase (GGDEF)-like protein
MDLAGLSIGEAGRRAERAQLNRNDPSALRYGHYLRLSTLSTFLLLVWSIALTAVFWASPVMPLVFVWVYASAVMAFIRMREARAFESGEAEAPPPRAISRSIILSGLMWGGLICALMAVGSPSQRLLLGALAASLVCLGAFNHARYPRASFIYSLIVALFTIVGLWMNGADMLAEQALVFMSFLAGIQALSVISARQAAGLETAMAELRTMKEGTARILEEFQAHAADWIWSTDSDGRLTCPVGVIAESLDLPHDALDGKRLTDCLSPSSATELAAIFREKVRFRSRVFHAEGQGGGRVWILSGQPSPGGGFTGVGTDITRTQEAQARLAFVAQHDALTGLPNRRMFLERLSLLIAQKTPFVAYCIDLDKFKTINDAIGHVRADRLLKSIAERLADFVEGDSLLARLGGDEFAFLLPLSNGSDPVEFADLIGDALLAPVFMKEGQILTGGSIGAVFYPDHGSEPDEILRNAELALYKAKAMGGGGACFYEPGMLEHARYLALLETDLRAALASNALEVYFQPQLDPATHRVTGYETLLRWNRPGHGLVSPAEFIPCAEETGLIVPFGDWVIRTAIEEASAWQEDARVAINLSPTQIASPTLISTIVSAIAGSGLDASRVEMEITESVFMQDSEQSLRTLHAIKGLGLRVALDDFGTGYASLGYLRRFPFDKIKIDQSFIRDIDTVPENQAIVRAIMQLARDLGAEVTAEGVETERQAAMLQALGCGQVQGFYYARPAPAHTVPKRQRATAEVIDLAVRRVS